ncbi:MAG: BNR repeat-containing protein [Planctomycetota bacterium]|nr:BNR repeat-containing protein [Planctomycetota bacterium]
MKSWIAAVASGTAMLAGLHDAHAVNEVDGNLVRFNDNGAWSWFEDERAIIDNGRIIVSSIANGGGVNGAARAGDVDVVSFDLATRRANRSLLSKIQADDHNTAALLKRPDGRYLAAYSNHGSDTLTRYRISTNPGDTTAWQPVQTFNNGAGTTYSNLFHLSAENKTYNFTRTNGFDPNWLVSSNQGDTWSYGGWLVKDPAGSSGTRPYVKYASNDVDKVYFITSEGHPRNVNNSLYAGYFAAGNIYQMNGTLVGPAGNTLATAQSLTNLTPVFAAQAETAGNRTRAWTTDLAVDASGNPYGVFTTRVNPGTNDHRFHYAKWTGTAWAVNELAQAGPGLYIGEDDYTGLVAMDPNDANTLYMSTSIDPTTSAALGNHEIYKGVTGNNGASWTWTAITRNSTVDNLRPIMPKSSDGTRALMWFRGDYTTYTNYSTSVVGLIDTPAPQPTVATYVDASPTNTFTLTGLGPTPESPSQGATDNRWHRRTGFGNGGSLLTADEAATTEDAAILRTSVSGLAAGEYDVWAYFWTDIDERWQLQAGFSEDSIDILDERLAQLATLDELLGATTVVTDTGSHVMYRAYLGRVGLDGIESLDVFIDDGTGAGASRTWYDGIGYALVPEPTLLAPLALAGVLLMRRRAV